MWLTGTTLSNSVITYIVIVGKVDDLIFTQGIFEWNELLENIEVSAYGQIRLFSRKLSVQYWFCAISYVRKKHSYACCDTRIRILAFVTKVKYIMWSTKYEDLILWVVFKATDLAQKYYTKFWWENSRKCNCIIWEREEVESP